MSPARLRARSRSHHTPPSVGRAPGYGLGAPYAGRVRGQRPVGTVTRGTTNPDRLRRCDGTCDGLGRLAVWVAVTADGPLSLTRSWRLRGLERPGVVAERLPKALIHRNVPGERVHSLLGALYGAWARPAPQASYGARQRFIRTAGSLRAAGWPLLDGPARWRIGELTVASDAVAPGSGPGDRGTAARAAHQGP